MGIDGIGKPPPIGPTGAPLGPTATSPTTSQFEVGAAEQLKPSGELARLERGEIGLDAYLDGKVGSYSARAEAADTAWAAPGVTDVVDRLVIT